MSEKTEWANTHGHGWVIPNPEGLKARCMGPPACPVCRREGELGRPLTSQEERAAYAEEARIEREAFSQNNFTASLEALAESAQTILEVGMTKDAP